MAASVAAAPLPLEQAVATALAQNPRLAGQEALVEAARQRPSQAGALPDPVVSLGALSLPTDTFERDQEAMTQLQLGVSQSFPFPGKLDLRREEAEIGVAVADQELAESRLTVARDVRRSWWRLYYLDRALEQIGHNQNRLRALIRVAESRYRVGGGSQQEVLAAQVDLSDQLNREQQFRGQRRSEEAQLRALLRWRDPAPIELPLEPREALPPTHHDEPALRREALAARPLLEAARRERMAAQKRLAQAERDRYPDLTLSLNYGLRDGRNPDGSERADLASLVLGVKLPLYFAARQGPAIAQRAAELRAADHTIDRRLEQVNAEIAEALAELEQSVEQARLLRDGVIPQTRQTFASLMAGYQVNTSGFDKLVRTQLLLNSYEIQYWKAVTDAWRAHAQLLAAIGLEHAR